MRSRICSNVSCGVSLTSNNASVSVLERGNGYCKDCSKARANFPKEKERRRQWMEDFYIERRVKIDEIKLQNGCFDCGYRYHPAALQFDHIDPSTKLFKISAKWNYSWPKILKEIEKCNIRCANCHAVHTTRERHTTQ